MVLFLLGHSFFAGIVAAFYLTAALQLFIEQFEASIALFLPLGYIASAAVGYAVLFVYRRLEPRISFARLLVGNLSFLFISVGILGVLSVLPVGGAGLAAGALAFCVYVWFRVLFSLRNVLFWSLANFFFDLRQGKRLFGLISTGEVISALIGFFSIPLLLRIDSFEGAHLILICMFFLAAWLVFLLFTIRAFKDKFAEGRIQKAAQRQVTSQPVRFTDSRYMLLFGLLAVFPMFAIYVDYIFLNAARIQFDVKAIGSFIALFYGFARIVEFFFKTVISGKLINRLGLGVGLAVLPAALLVSTGLATLSGVMGIGILLFIFVSLGRLFDRVLRPSVNDPSFQVLFQPLPEDQRIAFQPKIEGTARQLGTALVGVLLIVFGVFFTNGGFGNPESGFKVHVFVVALGILLIILIGWLVTVRLMDRAYRLRLKEILTETSVQGNERAKPFESADMLAVLQERLRYAPRQKVVDALHVLQMMEPSVAQELVNDLLTHEDPFLREAALKEIGVLKMTSASEPVARLLEAEAEPGVRERACAVLRVLQKARADGQCPRQMAHFARSDAVEDRVYAARLLAQDEALRSPDLLTHLLQDGDLTVRQAAIAATAPLAYQALWPLVVANLASSTCFYPAMAALVKSGPAMLPSLKSFANKMIERPRVLQRILRIYERIDHPDTTSLLWDQINHPSDLVKDQALRSLSFRNFKLHRDQRAVLRQKIDDTLAVFTWNAAARLDLENVSEAEPVYQSLEREFAGCRKRLFRLLAVLYDDTSIRLVQERLRNGDEEEQVFALELLDVLLDQDQDMKSGIFAVIEQLPPVRCLKRLDYPQARLSVEERLKDIINQGAKTCDRWTKVNALRALATVFPQTPHRELIANLFNVDQVLVQAAAMGLQQIKTDTFDFDKYVDSLDAGNPFRRSRTFKHHKQQTRSNNGFMLMMDKVNFLKRIDIFSEVSETSLLSLVSELHEVKVGTNQGFMNEPETDDDIFIMIDGGVRVDRGPQGIRYLDGPEVLGEMDVLLSRPRSVSCTTTAPSRFFQINGASFVELISAHFSVAGNLIAMFDEV